MNRIIPQALVATLALLTTNTDPVTGQMNFDIDGNEIQVSLNTAENGAMLISVTGQFDQVNTWLKNQLDNKSLNPLAILSDGNNGSILSNDADADDFQRQVIIIGTTDGTSIASLVKGIKKDEIKDFQANDFQYVQVIAKTGDHLSVTAYDDGYTVDNKWGAHAHSAMLETYFNGKKLRGAMTDNNEVFFIGSSMQRDIYASKGNKITLLDPAQTTDGVYRVTVTEKGITLGIYGDSTVYSIGVDSVMQSLGSDTVETDFAWTTTEIKGKLVELSNDIGDGTLLVSVRETDASVIPLLEIVTDDTYSLTVMYDAAIMAADYGDEVQVPVSRFRYVDSEKQHVLAGIDTNGSDNAVSFGNFDGSDDEPAWQQRLASLGNEARSGQLRQRFAA